MGSPAISLPPGFVLDQQPQSAAPSLPDGFVLDAPSKIPAAIADVPKEIAGAFNENLDTVKNAITPKDNPSTFGGFLDTGKALLAIPGMLASPVVGAARSLGGHPYADTLHAIGSVVNPQVAAQDNPQQMYEDAKGRVDTAMMAAAPRGASPIGVRMKPAPIATAPELKADAVSTFQDPAIKSIQIPPQDVANLAAQTQGELIQRGFRPSAGNAPGTFAEVDRMTPGPGVPAVGVDDLRSARRALNITAKQRDPIGQATPDAVAAQHAISRIDGFLDTVAPEIRTANANYAASKQAGMLDYRAQRADRRAAKTGSGSNIENTMRQEADKIGNRGLTADEIAARDQIVEGTPLRNALRKIGKLGFSDGLSLMYHAGLTLPTAGVNLPIGVGATVARKIGESLTRAELAALNAAIRARAPLSQSRPPVPVAPPPSPMLGSAVVPPQLQQVLGLGVSPFGLMPAHADQNQQRRGR